jgi:hypothetical protein
MYWQPGDPFYPLRPLTVSVKKCGIAEDARGVVTFVDTAAVSFYLERGIPGAGFIEARCPLALFAANFGKDPFRVRMPQYGRPTHYEREFPAAFFAHW